MMNTLLLSLSLLLATPAAAPDVQDGDLVFQTSTSSQSAAIRLVTKSPWSHMGIVFLRDGEPWVLEAVQPVKWTRLDAWIARGEGKRVAIKRLANADAVLTPDVIAKMRAEGEAMVGKPYDLQFVWDDDRLYCSELAWKIYQRGAGLEIGAPQKLKDLDLSHPVVKALVKERTKGMWLDPEQTLVSPQAMFEDAALVNVPHPPPAALIRAR